MTASHTRRFYVRLGLVAVLLLGALAYLALQRYRVTPQEHFDRARVALQNGDFAAVEQAIWALEGEEEFAHHRNFLTAACMIQEGELSLALTLLRQAAESPALRVDAMVLAGQALYGSGRAGDAERIWTAALELDPNAAEAHRGLGEFYYEVGGMQQAMAHLEQAAASAPDDPRPHRLMAQIYKADARFDRAVQHYQESLRRDPQQPGYADMLIELAESQIKLYDYQAGLETLESCPDGAPRLVLEGECLYGLGRADAALAALERSLQQHDGFFPALQLKGTILLDRGEHEAAAEVLSTAIEMYPKEYFARFKLAQALRRAGHEERADEHDAIATVMREKFERFYDLQTTAVDQPENADLRYELGLLAEELGFPSEHWYRAALAADANHTKARAKLEQQFSPH